jgi:hypothetical protein
MLRRAFQRLWYAVTLNPLRRAVATGLGVAAIGAAVAGAMTADHLVDSCAPGVFHRGPGGQCIGVTDGSFDFEPQLHAVDQEILRENASLAGKTYVSVALLLPMTDPSPAMQAEIVHEVQGAYTAQYQANNVSEVEGLVPSIKLVLANPGVGSAEYLPVDQQLYAMRGASARLRAVTGISVSTDTTKNEVGWLTGHRIAVVGGAITADDLANSVANPDKYPGLARVEPTNEQGADALISFAKAHHAQLAQSVLVFDSRTDDDYITTLKSAFNAAVRGGPIESVPFTSPPDISQEGSTGNQLGEIASSFCPAGAQWIYFAGRQVQLRQFIDELASAPCPHRHFIILTGDAGSHLAADPKLSPQALGPAITLYYAAIASPDAWKQDQVPATGGSKQDYKTFAHYLDQAVGADAVADLGDGQAIINYDATWTAIAGIRKATGTGTSTPANVGSYWSELRGSSTSYVHGASGWICLDNAGNPWDKAVPIEQLAGRTPEFVQLAWPAGYPPNAACQVPASG